MSIQLAKAEITRLQECHEATIGGTYIMATRKQMEKALANELATCNDEIADGKTIAWRTTENGEKFLASLEMPFELTPDAPHSAQTGGPIIMGFEIKTFTNPEEFMKVGKTGRESKYPFDHLELNQGFDVEPTSDNPEPWKSLQSTVSTASRRFATVTGTKTGRTGKALNEYEFERRFKVVKVKADDGAFVARVIRTI